MARTSQGSEKLSSVLRMLDEAVDEKREEIRNLVSDQFENFKEVVSEVKPAIKDTIRSSAKHLSSVTNDAKEMVAEKTKELSESVDRQVKKHPWRFIGGAAFVALILGYMLGRKE